MAAETELEQRPLGAQGLKVSAIGLGCMGMTHTYGRADAEACVATVRHALARGVCLLDTADAYGPYTNEELIGRAVVGFRDRAVIATKFGVERKADGSIAGINGRPEYVRAACDRSLQRLGIDHIDLYYQHRVDRSVPIEDTVGAMADLVHAGKVRYLGLSEAAPATVRRAHAVHPISALQTEYSLFTRDPEAELLPTAHELGIGFVAYSPLGRGFLTGTMQSIGDLTEDDSRRGTPRFSSANFEHNRALAARVASLASELGITSAQLALAWVMARGGVIPIPGTTKQARLDENIAAASVRLGHKVLEQLDALAPPGAAAGARYAPAAMHSVNR